MEKSKQRFVTQVSNLLEKKRNVLAREEAERINQIDYDLLRNMNMELLTQVILFVVENPQQMDYSELGDKIREFIENENIYQDPGVVMPALISSFARYYLLLQGEIEETEPAQEEEDISE